MSVAAESVTTPALKLLASLTMPVRWRDLDAFEHVNNAAYLTYLEEARLHWFATIPDWATQASAPVVAAVHVNYRRQLGWPATLSIELLRERVGNSSLTIAYRIADAADRNVVYADGNTVLVWVESATGKSVALPRSIVAACR